MWLTYGYYSYYMYMLPAILLVLFAQLLVSARYNRFGKVPTYGRVTGKEVAEEILRQNGITDIQVCQIAGKMTDHYHPTKKVINLSEGVYGSTSVAAVGIAAHEAGHAVQHAKGYVPIKIRTALVPVCNLGATLSFPLLILGVVMNAFALVNIGLILFATATVFQLVTLPVEFNASRRAMAFIKTSNLFSRDEISGARKVLTAAAFTYVAALAQSVLQLLYYVMRFSGNRRR